MFFRSLKEMYVDFFYGRCVVLMLRLFCFLSSNQVLECEKIPTEISIPLLDPYHSLCFFFFLMCFSHLQ